MNISSLFRACITLTFCTLLTACNGGVEDISLPQPVNTARISGVASKGPIRNGTIEFYTPSSSGAPDRLLTTAATDNQGHYTATLGAYAGPVVIVATGSYDDEATGQTRGIDSSAPLHALLPCSCASTLVAAVTPLTELAYQKARTAIAGGADVATAFSSANAQVSDLFSFDVATTLPVPPVQNDLVNAANDQRNYTLALAAISQMVKDTGGTVASVIAGLNNSGNAAPAQVAAALVVFLNSNANNQTGYKGVSLSFSLTGVTTTKVSALDVSINLPAGTAIPADSTGTVAPVNFSLSGNAVSAFSTSNYTAATGTIPAKLKVGIATLNPLLDGPFAVLGCSVPTATPPGAFAVSSVSAKNENGVTIPGIGVTIQSLLNH